MHLSVYSACLSGLIWGVTAWLTMQVVLFTNDTTVSKGMVKYASNLSRESIIDVEGTIAVPQEPIAACTQSEVVLSYCSCLELPLCNLRLSSAQHSSLGRPCTLHACSTHQADMSKLS